MASLRKAKKQAKKMGIEFKTPEAVKRKKLETQIKKQVNETNKRLRALDRKGFYNSFSSKKLFDRLGGKINALEKIGEKIIGVKIRKNMNITELTALSKATKNFLRSATSTPFKTKSVIRKTKESMYQTMKKQNDKLTMEDIETYYDMLGDNDFDYFAGKEGGSPIWHLIGEAIEAEDDQEAFLKRFNSIITLNDVDVRRRAINLFNKYVL